MGTGTFGVMEDKMKRFLLSLSLLIASVSFAIAQNPVITTPSAMTISAINLTISSSSAFQSVLPASTQTTGRIDCIIQNKSNNNMFIYFGPPAAAISLYSLTLAAGATFRCANSGVVIKNEISIGGTSGDRFFAGQ